MNICAVTQKHVFGNEDIPLKECFHCIFYSVAFIAFVDKFRQWNLQAQFNAVYVGFANILLLSLFMDQTLTFLHTSTRKSP